MMSILQQINNEITDVIHRAHQSLVRISNGQQGIGAGTIWHSDGMVITSAHVIANARHLRVSLYDGEELPARMLAYDRDADLAALVIDGHDLPIIEPGNAKALKTGEWVMALGHPWGVPGGVTGGTVIGVGASLPEMPPMSHEWVAVSLHMRPGHSGGALIDSKGRLLGVNTMISGPELGLAVPVHLVKAFLKRKIV
ncbi:MAG TPA: trypsin-like peptidase domain-containing protein [Aggregatilineales bacterium]|nr:trypsin-like peptidase domain-containing protein [Aggregatilineales bacterium]